MEKLDGDPALEAAARANPIENVRLSFDHKVEDAIEEIYESNGGPVHADQGGSGVR